jgi:hypothetical protein
MIFSMIGMIPMAKNTHVNTMGKVITVSNTANFSQIQSFVIQLQIKRAAFVEEDSMDHISRPLLQ